MYQEFQKANGGWRRGNQKEKMAGLTRRIPVAAGEFGRRDLGTPGFGSAFVRHCLFAVDQTRATDGLGAGLTWLKDRENVPDYWASRERIIGVLDFLASLKNVATMSHWHPEAHAAELLAGAVRNDHV